MPSSAFEGLEHTCRVCKGWVPADQLATWVEERAYRDHGRIWFVHVHCHPSYNPLTKHIETANIEIQQGKHS